MIDTTTQRHVRQLTDDQIKLLAEKLVDSKRTLRQVRALVWRMFRLRIGDNICERLRTVGLVFRCGECDSWLPVDCEAKQRGEMCRECDFQLNFS